MKTETPPTQRSVIIDHVTIFLAHPDELQIRWVGQEELMKQLMAAWMIVDPKDVPMNPRLLGKPGVGKTTLAYAVAKQMGREVYIMQSTMDTRPEDLLVTPVVESGGKLRYVGSPLVTAMIRGGIAILDEGNRMSEKSWASLAPLLDTRRYVESIVAGIKINAHPNFRMVATMNDDASTFELPEYIHSRLQPQILLDFPEREEELLNLEGKPPFCGGSGSGLRDGFSASGPRSGRTVHRARRNQHGPLCLKTHRDEGKKRLEGCHADRNSPNLG